MELIVEKEYNHEKNSLSPPFLEKGDGAYCYVPAD